MTFVLAGVLILSQGAHFNPIRKMLIGDWDVNRAFGNKTEAYKVVINNFKEGDSIFGYYARVFYLQPLIKNGLLHSESQIISLLGQYYGLPTEEKLSNFKKDIQAREHGWIIADSEYFFRLDKALTDYIQSNFTQHHGRAVDHLNVEVYSFDTTMID